MSYVQTFLTLLLFSTVSFSGPEAFAFGGGKPSAPEYSAKIEFSGDVPETQVEQIKKDLIALTGLTFKNQDAETLRIMKLDQLNPEALQSWLEDRVQYVVGDALELELDKGLYIADRSYAYENPNELPDFEEAPEHPSNGKKVYTVMANIGAGIYMAIKPKSILLGLDMAGIGKVALTSPRVGVIKIGEGLFLPLRRKQGGKETDTLGNSVFRLSVFFHEARHSDGHGKSLGFAHALCPQGHDYADYNACDRNLNGPYTVGALTTRAFFDACDHCSVEDREALKLATADAFNRILKSTPVAPVSDAILKSRIEIAELELETCELLLRYKARAPEECQALEKEIEKLKADLNTPQETVSIPSVEWDDRPEGSR